MKPTNSTMLTTSKFAPPQVGTPLRFAYFGTPTFSTLVLKELATAGCMPALVITTPDKPAGRGLALTKSPVKLWAEAHTLPVLQPEKLRGDFIEEFKKAGCELLIVAAYGKILPLELLSLPSKGALNVHPSLLPRYRGTSPVESQIFADEKNIGVSVISMDAEMDHGPIVAQEKISLSDWPISRSILNDVLWRAGGKLLAKVMSEWVRGEIKTTPQDHAQATFTKKITKEDGLIDPAGDARQNYLKYLAYEGWPGVYFFDDGKRIKITKARFENNQFIIERVIPEGKAEIDYLRE